MRGNNLHLIEIADGERFLVSMPTKFRNWIWIKRGECLYRLFLVLFISNRSWSFFNKNKTKVDQKKVTSKIFAAFLKTYLA